MIELPLGIDEIRRLLPHRYPMLLVDRIVEFEDNVRVKGIKCVTANEQFFTGHFPERPIMPGVLMLEALAQLGIIFAKLTTGGMGRDQMCFFAGAESVKFRRPVVPGDVLVIEMSLIKRRASHWKMQGLGTVDGEKVMEAVLLAAEAPE
jgi:beta-hydroxyacyl-ACP dehydratase FabZ